VGHGELPFGGRWVKAAATAGGEARLPSIEHFRGADQVPVRELNQLLLGISTLRRRVKNITILCVIRATRCRFAALLLAPCTAISLGACDAQCEAHRASAPPERDRRYDKALSPVVVALGILSEGRRDCGRARPKARSCAPTRWAPGWRSAARCCV
jgi:hypothetical protein